MKPLSTKILEKANEQAIYNLYLYLIHKDTPAEGETLQYIVKKLETELKSSKSWKDRDIYRLKVLRNAVNNNPTLANSKISNITHSKSGLTACSFIKSDGNISVVFKGTGDGEWIDNGEGLSGIPEENLYITYGIPKIIAKDYATDQQVEALNWFNGIAAKNVWNEQRNITVSGHSKGGNKAQFITVHSDLVDECYSFDGQGFSPEAITALKKQYGRKYLSRRQKINSISADNDYVNVLGERLATVNHIYFFKSFAGFHYLEAILDVNGRLRSQSEQGKLSKYIEKVSEDLMRLPPVLRQYATLGIMNVFQRYLGKGIPVNGDNVSLDKTIAGIGIALGPLLHNVTN